MTELHLRIPDDVAERLASEAAARGVTSEDLAAEVLATHVPRANGSTKAGELSFIGLAKSKPGFSAKEAEEQLEAEGFV